MKQGILAVVATSLALASGPSWADKESITTKVLEVFTDPTKFGGCGAYIQTPITMPACRSLSTTKHYVQFDCLKQANTPSAVSSRNFNQAQLALVTGYDAFVFVSTDTILNGICFADRINVLHPDKP